MKGNQIIWYFRLMIKIVINGIITNENKILIMSNHPPL